MEQTEQHKKPPLGVMPRRIWVEKRCDELIRAIHEYKTEGLSVNFEWLVELSEHLNWLRDTPFEIDFRKEDT